MTLRTRIARWIDPDYDVTCELLDSYREHLTLRMRLERAESRAAGCVAAYDQTCAELAQARAALGRKAHPSAWEEGA